MTDKQHSLSKQREIDLKITLWVDTARSSSTTRQGRSEQTRANVNTRPDEASVDD